MSRSRLSLRLSEAAQLLWIRSLEEADTAGSIIPGPARMAASREADTPEDAAFLTRRAAILTNQLPAELQTAPADRAAAKWHERLPGWAPPAIAGGAFLLGLGTNALGPADLINILSFPLLGLILWNLAVCAISLAADWKLRRQKPPAPAISPPRSAAGTDPVRAAADAWRARHREWEKPRTRARLAIAFHAAAIALAAGVVAGMYLRGLAKEYHVRWESTFLSEQQVRAVTRVVLGPASRFTGIPVPDPKPDTSAAPWIHLWAASAGLFILIPRLLLINMARRQAAKHRPDYSSEFAGWLSTCRSMTGTHTSRAEVISLHFEPDARVRDSVRSLIQQRWGAHVGAEFHAPLQYGSEQLPAVTAPPQFLVVIVNLSATPESEIHGAILRTLASTTPAPERRLLVLDASGFAARFRALPEYKERLTARRSAWHKAAGDFPVILLPEQAA